MHQNAPATKAKEAVVTAENYKEDFINQKITEFNQKYGKNYPDRAGLTQKITEVVTLSDQNEDGSVQFEEWKVAEKQLKAFLQSKQLDSQFEAIPNREALTKRKKSEVVKFVLAYPEKAMEFFMTDNGDDTLTVNFDNISQTLLGLGHFRAFTDKYQQVEVNGVIGTLAVKSGHKKPGYFTAEGNYIAIWDGDVVKGIPRKTVKTDEEMSESGKAEAEIAATEYENYKKEADALNQNYVEGLITDEMTAEEVREKLIEKFSAMGIKLGDLDLKDKESMKAITPDKWNEVITGLSGKEIQSLVKSLGRKNFADFIKMCGLEHYGQLSRNQIAEKAQKVITEKFQAGIFPGAGIDEAKLVGSLMYHESAGGRPYAINYTGNCLGLGQIQDNNYLNWDSSGGTKGFNPFDPNEAVFQAVRYLQRNYAKFASNKDALKLAVVSYNRGEGFAEKALKNHGDNWYTMLPQLTSKGRVGGTYGKEGHKYWKVVDDIYHDRVKSRMSGFELSGEKITSNDLIANIESLLNTTYRLGGENESGIDCSGVVMKALIDNGIANGDTTAAGFYDMCRKAGTLQDNTDHGKIGDCIFWKKPSGRIYHIEVITEVLGNGKYKTVGSSSDRVNGQTGVKYRERNMKKKHSIGRLPFVQ